MFEFFSNVIWNVKFRSTKSIPDFQHILTDASQKMIGPIDSGKNHNINQYLININVMTLKVMHLLNLKLKKTFSSELPLTLNLIYNCTE